MDRWKNRVALVTGASSGIGAAIVKELVLKGMKVIGVARRVERIEALASELQELPGILYSWQCDVAKEADVLAVFAWANTTLGGVDVLVNSAGLGAMNVDLASGGVTGKWREMLEVNVLGLSMCTREAVKSMRKRGVDDGHVIHINSIVGHQVIHYPGVGMYAASKFAVTALTEALRRELVNAKSAIRVTSISPGTVRTDILIACGAATDLRLFDEIPCLEPKDIGDSVIFALAAPAHVQVHELTIRPVGQRDEAWDLDG